MDDNGIVVFCYVFGSPCFALFSRAIGMLEWLTIAAKGWYAGKAV